MFDKKIGKVILLIGTSFIVASALIYSITPKTDIPIASGFISAIGTIGILVLTGFYVAYMSEQISEMRKQRELQLVPLPNLRIIEGEISRPILLKNPYDGDILPGVDLYLKCCLENVGNASAVAVDTIIEINERRLNRQSDSHWSRRFHVIK